MMSKRDLLGIWAVVIPAVVKTLRRFQLTGSTGSLPWDWNGPGECGVRVLLGCKKLEEIELPFTERSFVKNTETIENSLPIIINEFVRNCPKLYRIYTGSVAANFYVASSVLNTLKHFQSTDGVFKGRDVEVMLKQYASGSKTALPPLGDDEDMVGVFDYHVYRWRLKEKMINGQGIYGFERMRDRCWMRNDFWDDD
ncbi:hypothetical protein TWF718_004565 [Orbilia javanica]|uniref:Uncharacterized protein n=1 Tax=Orbilia javanica TaxID=47235 RepID=A0AAN8NBQ0_9PEZI